MDFVTFIVLTWIVGAAISTWVYMSRAGLGFLVWWGIPRGYRLMYFALNIQWQAVTYGKCLVWPVVLVVWLARARPVSPWTVAGQKYGVPLVRRVEGAALHGIFQSQEEQNITGDHR